jgi:hypothetical protein
MNSIQLISELKNLGYVLYPKGGKIRLKFIQKGEPSKEKAIPLLKKLKKHKAEVMECLGETQNRINPDLSKIECMTLTEFAQTNLALKVYSSVLGETVYFASNDIVAEKLKGDGLVIYATGELEQLIRKKLNPKALKAIYEAKRVFPGSKIVN